MKTTEAIQPKTLEFFAVTRGHNLKCKSGLLTFEQIANIGDAYTGVKVCCSHAFHGHDAPHFQKMIDQLPNMKSSLASIRSMLATWEKWTHHDGPTLSNVQSFLWAMNRS